MYVFWKDVLHQSVNTILPFKKKVYISCISPKIHTTDSSVEHKEYLNYVALRTLRYSWRFSTVGTTLLFTESVNNTNITVHILQCVTVMNQDTLQHFPPVPHQHHFHTQDCISQTVWAVLKVAPVLMYWDICMYIGYQQFGFWYMMEEKLGFTFIFILPLKRPHIRNSEGHILTYLGGAPYLMLKSRCGYAEYLLILFGCIVALDSTQHLPQTSGDEGDCLCVADNFATFMCRLSRNSGSLKLLQH